MVSEKTLENQGGVNRTRLAWLGVLENAALGYWLIYKDTHTYPSTVQIPSSHLIMNYYNRVSISS